jgi:hypothetical protein
VAVISLGATCSAKTRRNVSAASGLVIAARNRAKNVSSSSHTAKKRGSNMSATSSGSTFDRSGRSITKSAAAANRSCLLPK